MIMQCPKCKSNQTCKNGFVRRSSRKGLQAEYQRFKCKACTHEFKVNAKPPIPKATKSLAIFLFHCGYSQKSIADFLEVSTASVSKWLSPLKNEGITFQDKTSKLRELTFNQLLNDEFVSADYNSKRQGKYFIVIRMDNVNGPQVRSVIRGVHRY